MKEVAFPHLEVTDGYLNVVGNVAMLDLNMIALRKVYGESFKVHGNNALLSVILSCGAGAPSEGATADKDRLVANVVDSADAFTFVGLRNRLL